MQPELLAVLLAADDSVEPYEPAGFDWQAEVARLRPLLPLVETAGGRPFELETWAQDASFFADIVTIDQDAVPDIFNVIANRILCVRFSSFGHLFTVWSVVAPEKELAPEVVARVIEVVGQHGYQYVPYEALDGQPYTGSNPYQYLQGVDWFRRYFDYL